MKIYQALTLSTVELVIVLKYIFRYEIHYTRIRIKCQCVKFATTPQMVSEFDQVVYILKFFRLTNF